mmetsp:Transcript_27950/g.39302  ORF Transcript_27950/g.39302 Transcript_27950/m.39302 type:complete len:390 (+) Transcript_27950:75-1244(+)
MAPVLGDTSNTLDHENNLLDDLLKDDESGVCPDSPRTSKNLNHDIIETTSTITTNSFSSESNIENKEIEDLVTPLQKNSSKRDINLAINDLINNDRLSPSSLSETSPRSTRIMPDSVAFTKKFLQSTSEALGSSPRNKRRSKRNSSASPSPTTASGEESSSFGNNITANNITDDIRDLFLSNHSSNKGGTSNTSDPTTAELLGRARERIEHQQLMEQVQKLRRRVQEKDARIVQLTAQLRRATAAKCDLVLACTEIEGQLENIEKEGERNVQNIKRENLRLVEKQSQMEIEYINEMGKLTEKIRDMTRRHQNEILEKEFQLAKSQETIRRLKCSINTKAANQSITQNRSAGGPGNPRMSRPNNRRPPSSIWKKDTTSKNSTKIPEKIML